MYGVVAASGCTSSAHESQRGSSESAYDRSPTCITMREAPASTWSTVDALLFVCPRSPMMAIV
jgi:hypothetical protein